MSPIDPHDLRRELQSVDPGYGSHPGDLGRTVIQRGRAVKRRRTAVGVVAAALVVAGGFGITQVLPLGNRDAVPAKTITATTETPSPTSEPSPTAAETPTTEPPTTPPPSEPATTPATTGAPDPEPTGQTSQAVPDPSATTGEPLPDPDQPGDVVPVEPEEWQPIWTDTLALPGELGDIGGVTLLHAGDPGDEIASPWTVEDYTVRCLDLLTLQNLTDLTASRVISSSGGESFGAEGVLVFRNIETAQAFMADLTAQSEACVTRAQETLTGDNAPVVEGYRMLYAQHPYSDSGEEGLIMSDWSEMLIENEWLTAPGGSATLWVRQGQTVTFASTGGEYVGDPVTNDSGAVDVARESVDHVLAQL